MRITPLIFYCRDILQGEYHVSFVVADDAPLAEADVWELVDRLDVLGPARFLRMDENLIRLSESCIRFTCRLRRHSGKRPISLVPSSMEIVYFEPPAHSRDDGGAIDWSASKTQNLGSDDPPKLAIQIAYWLLPRKHRAVFVGDIMAEYEVAKGSLGSRGAKWWFWKELCAECWPICSWRVRRSARWFLYLSGGASVVEVLRRFFTAL